MAERKTTKTEGETLDAAKGSVVTDAEGNLAIDEGSDNRDPAPSVVEHRDTVRNQEDRVSTSVVPPADAERTAPDLDAAKGSVLVDPDNPRALIVDEGTDRRDPRPSPVENRDPVVNQADSNSVDDSVFLASLDDEEREVVVGNRAGYMVGNFDTTAPGGAGVLTSLAFPSKAAVKAAEKSGRRVADVGDAARTTGEELVGGETRRAAPTREESAHTEEEARKQEAKSTAESEAKAPVKRTTSKTTARKTASSTDDSK